MKKLLAIVVLGLFLSGSTYGSEVPQIKEKSLKCLYKDYKNKYKVNKENYLYIIFSDDRKKATMIGPVTKDSMRVYKSTWEVETKLKKIVLTAKYQINDWDLYRLSGVLKERMLTNPYTSSDYGKCEPVKKDFDPIKFMEDFVKKNIERTKKELKF